MSHATSPKKLGLTVLATVGIILALLGPLIANLAHYTLESFLQPTQMSAAVATSRDLPASVGPAVIRDYPVTALHAPPADLDKYIPQPGMPRANKAISKENPHGSTKSPPNATVLQQHVLFWDQDGDGVIYPWDTYSGFRRLGFGYLISGLAPFVIHGTFSYPTSHSWIPNPLFPINLDRVHRTKHGSDSEVFDTEGRYVPEKFEEIFSKFDRENKGGLSWRDIQEMVHANMNVNDPVGWIAERLEWWTLYLLCKDERGIVSKERIRACYDGTLWDEMAEVAKRRKPANLWGALVGGHVGQKKVA